MKLNNVKTGERLSLTYYVEVLSRNGEELKVRDSNGQTFTIKGKKLIETTINSASQFENEEKVTRTEAVEKLLSARDSAFTVVFDKQDGSERTLVGKLLDSENYMGRSNVVDLEITTGSPNRQVDHRTLRSLILRGTKYTVKK